MGQSMSEITQHLEWGGKGHGATSLSDHVRTGAKQTLPM